MFFIFFQNSFFSWARSFLKQGVLSFFASGLNSLVHGPRFPANILSHRPSSNCPNRLLRDRVCSVGSMASFWGRRFCLNLRVPYLVCAVFHQYSYRSQRRHVIMGLCLFGEGPPTTGGYYNRPVDEEGYEDDCPFRRKRGGGNPCWGNTGVEERRLSCWKIFPEPGMLAPSTSTFFMTACLNCLY